MKNYVVAIGASAGGLEAIHELFDNMPTDTGFSFVIIQHLSPDYKSLMPELLAKHTSMRIVEGREGMLLERNCIYVIPSKKIMTIKDGQLQLTEKKDSHQPNNAIDSFFTSLAQEKGNKAVGIILSGTGTDGTKGIAAIKANGGIAIVQDPVTARFDGMPNSAIASGHADLILPPEMMAEELSEYIIEAPFLKAFNELNEKDESTLNEILEIVKKVTSHDFINYKKSTISRRMIKRMTQVGKTTLQDYRNLLLADTEEVIKLSKEFLIGVTKFFRDEEAFEDLRLKMIPQLVSSKEKGDTLKVWVVACSTGEEAYSIAILLQEYIEKNQRYDLTIKIFATDIDLAALEFASRGVYPASIAAQMPEDRLHKYFSHEGEHYKIIPLIRKMVVFAQHDILKDPPFSKIDLISCRNMLIYMNSELQQKVLKTFHFALNAGSYLFLGPSENIGILKDHMKEVNKKWKLFQTIERAKLLESGNFFSPLEKRLSNTGSSSIKPKNALNHLSDIFKETIIEEYNYASILIDKDFQVKQAIGNFKSFLYFPEDNFNFNLLKLVPPDLSIAISNSVRKAIKDNQKVTLKHLKIRDQNNRSRNISIIVKPYLQQVEYVQPFLFIVLNEEEQKKSLTLEISDEPGAQMMHRIQELEEELLETKENLQAVVEELETSNEELQSSNEEMISANEELQSTNEELQSLNEELHTVNAEHQLKIKELIELNDDLNNYFINSGIGQILVDKNLIIRRFTPDIKRQINLIESDIGRSISDISTNIKDFELLPAVKSVLQTEHPFVKEVNITDGSIYKMRITPYLRQDKKADGAVITFIDITELKELNEIIEGIFNSTINGIMALKAVRDNSDLIIDFECIAANNTSEELIGAEKGTLPGKRILENFPETKDWIFNRYVSVVETNENLFFEYYYDKVKKWFSVVGVKMMDGLVVTFTDITEQKKSHELLMKGYEDLRITSMQLQSSNDELERSNYDLMQFASVASHDLKEPLRKIQTYGNLLYSKAHSKLQDNELKYLEKMVRSSQRMQTLIDDVLTFSKLSNRAFSFTQTNLNEVISRIIEDLEIIIKEKNVHFSIAKLPELEAIPGQMNQLFQNLISNALKFNNSSEPYIHISAINVSLQAAEQFGFDPSDFISICVEDNGIGFNEKYKDKIFKIFQRLHNHNDYEGTGIGLAICKKIVENHNGYISVESEEGKGSKFVLFLPKQQHILKPLTNSEEAVYN